MNYQTLKPELFEKIRINTNLKVDLMKYFGVKYNTVEMMMYRESKRVKEYGAVLILHKYGFTDEQIFCQTQKNT